MGSRITKRQLRGRVFALKSLLKDYVRENGILDIRMELQVLRHMGDQVNQELEQEWKDDISSD